MNFKRLLSRSEAAKKAQELREKYNITEPPVNVFDIVKGEGISISYFKPDKETEDISGLFDKGSMTIFLNVEETPGRQSFTLAHELAHYVLDHNPNEYGVYKRDHFNQPDKPEKEKEADLFAAQLLMPSDFTQKAMKEYSLSSDDSEILANLFGVSRSAMTFRLMNISS